MNKKPLLFTSKRDDESIDAFKKQVINELLKKEWVNEDGSVDEDKLASISEGGGR